MVSKKKGDYPIPFNRVGDQLHYPEYEYADGERFEPVMKDNFVFEDTMKFDGMARGRSAAYFYFTRSAGTKVVVFMTDLCEMMPHLVNGEISGKFTFTKRGQNYGAILIGT